MMSAIAAVEARILDDPDDAAAWAAYAPYLLEQGDVRCELVALAALEDTPAKREALARIDRERARWEPYQMTDCVWRHGFVVGATLRIDGRREARDLAQRMVDPKLRLLGSLRLTIAETVPARALTVLAAADLGRLRVLRAAYHPRGNRVARALVEQPSLKLHTLDLRHAGLTDEALIALAGCAQLRGLRALYLQHNRLTSRAVAALARSPALTGVEVLDLRHNAVGAVGAAALAESPLLGAITALHLHADELEPAGVHALATSSTLPRDIVRYWRAQDKT